jgi:hypothetical protein
MEEENKNRKVFFAFAFVLSSSNFSQMFAAQTLSGFFMRKYLFIYIQLGDLRKEMVK